MQERRKMGVTGATGRVGKPIVELLEARGFDVVAMSRATGVDVVSGAGMLKALAGVEVLIDAATGPSPDQREATAFFEADARHSQQLGARAGVQRIIAVSIIGIDKLTVGYNAAKLAHEKALQAGPLPVQIVRAAQFHELVPQMIEWTTRGDVSYVPEMETQLVAASSVAEQLVEVASAADATGPKLIEVAGPRPESLVDAARRYLARRNSRLRVEGVSDPQNPDRERLENGGLLPNPGARLVGPSFDAWLARL